jgi:hypothetical protein
VVFKTDDTLKEVQIIWYFLRRDKIFWFGIVMAIGCSSFLTIVVIIYLHIHVLLSYLDTLFFLIWCKRCLHRSFKIQAENRSSMDKIDTTNTQMHGRSLTWLGTGTSIKTSLIGSGLL